MMFEMELAPIKSALSERFGDLKELYADVNVFEHRNETSCFCGIEGITYKDSVSDGAGGFSSLCEVSFGVSLWGKREMGAGALAEAFDQGVLPALLACAGEIKEIKRNPCRYSKEQNGYILSATLVFTSYQPGAMGMPPIEFSAGGISYSCMKSYEVKSTVKTAETPLISGVIKTRKVGMRPEVLTVKGELSGGAAYASLKALLGTAVSPLNVAGTDFSGMMMSGIWLSGHAQKPSEITLEFTGADEI